MQLILVLALYMLACKPESRELAEELAPLFDGGSEILGAIEQIRADAPAAAKKCKNAEESENFLAPVANIADDAIYSALGDFFRT